MPEGKSDDLIEAAIRVVDAAREDLLLAKASENKALLRQVAISVVHGALLAERQRDRWMPIEAAPKNYKPIWGCDLKRGYEAKVLHNGTEWECVSHDGFPMGVGFYPTHWQPLPDLPSTEENLQHD